MESQTLSCEFGWDAKEYRRLHRLVLWYGSQRWVIIGGIAVSAILLLMFVASAALNLVLGDLPTVSSLTLLTFPAVWGFFLFWWSPRAAAQTYAKLYEGPHRLDLDTDVVRATTAAGLNELKWHAFIERSRRASSSWSFLQEAQRITCLSGPFHHTAWKLCARCCVSGSAQGRPCAMIRFSTPVRACCD